MSPPQADTTTSRLIAGLRRCAKDVVVDDDVLEGYRRDQAAPGLLAAGMPAALVRVRSPAEVQATVQVARACGAPVVARGAGSGLSGGANAIDGCIVLSFERMGRVLDIDDEAMTATVEPGVMNSALRDAANDHGLWYAPDPASAEFCTVGGNVATNAGGLCCVKYGVTRDALLGLDAVLADGNIVRLGHRTRKGVAGYDLAGLMCGSEGTLGLITEVTVRLQRRPSPPVAVAASFPTLSSAGEATMRIARCFSPSLLELMDATTIAAVDEMDGVELDREAEALVFACADGRPTDAREEAQAMAAECERHGASLAVVSEDQAEGRMLLAARRLAYPALERLGTTLLDDVAVPLGAIAKLVGTVQRIAQEQGLLIATFGHAGDGNLHPTIVYDRENAEELARVRLAFKEIVGAALELGGTISGEHGVGVLKRDLLADELGGSLALNRSIKDALDPSGLLNPGKAI